jgi:hypothetical protein
MAKPIFKIGAHDYTKYISDEGLQPSRNDLDADGSGRNLLDGLMYRTRIATKQKWTVSFLRLDETVMSRLVADLDADFVAITMLDSKLNRPVTRTYYCSTINEGVQRYIGGRTVYDGVTFNLIER